MPGAYYLKCCLGKCFFMATKGTDCQYFILLFNFIFVIAIFNYYIFYFIFIYEIFRRFVLFKPLPDISVLFTCSEWYTILCLLHSFYYQLM